MYSYLGNMLRKKFCNGEQISVGASKLETQGQKILLVGTVSSYYC